jgi:hypothetical protein
MVRGTKGRTEGGRKKGRKRWRKKDSDEDGGVSRLELFNSGLPPPPPIRLQAIVSYQSLQKRPNTYKER